MNKLLHNVHKFELFNVIMLYMAGRTYNVQKAEKKAPMVEEQSAIEVVTRTEYIYEDTQCVSGVEPEYKWGDIYRLIS